MTDLVVLSGERTTLHRARVEIFVVVELDEWFRRLDVVENRRHATSQGEQSTPVGAEPDAHAALLGMHSTVVQQTAARSSKIQIYI